MAHETQDRPTRFRTVNVAGLDIFYREAGDAAEQLADWLSKAMERASIERFRAQ
jgi:hypothetical protein